MDATSWMLQRYRIKRLYQEKMFIIDGIAKITIFSSMGLMDGFHQILTCEWDISNIAVSFPIGILWEWLVMPQEWSDAPATLNRCVTNLLKFVRDFALIYSNDVFVHSRSMIEQAMWKYTEFTSGRFLHWCVTISCRPTSRSVSFLLEKYHF